MFPLFTISNRRPFAPAELPAFIATMGTSDSPAPLPSPSLFTLVGGCAIFCADAGVSLVTAQSLCQARYGLRSRVVRHGLPFQLFAVSAVACWRLETIGPFQRGHFGTATFTVGFTRYHCASPAFLPTHQAAHYWTACKAGYLARGWRLPRRDSHPLDCATLPSRNRDLIPAVP